MRWLRRLDSEWTPYGVDRIYEFARRSTHVGERRRSRQPAEVEAVTAAGHRRARTEDLGIRAAS